VASEWFAGDGHGPEGEAFLAELRALAGAWGLADVRAEDTGTAHDRWGWLVVWARVPGLRAGAADPQLQVGFGLTAVAPPLVAAWETGGCLLDAWVDLELSGFDVSQDGRARGAFTWLNEQLHRPVERRTWHPRRPWHRSYAGWYLADTGQRLHQDARRAEPPRRPPELVERLR
jgi:hypothetical protein